MNFKKLILPMLVLVCAIAMAFTSRDLKPEPKMVPDDSYATMYIYTDSWHPIEVECGEGFQDCEVVFTSDPSGTRYQVYNTQDLQDLAKGNGDIKPIPGLPPTN